MFLLGLRVQGWICLHWLRVFGFSKATDISLPVTLVSCVSIIPEQTDPMGKLNPIMYL